MRSAGNSIIAIRQSAAAALSNKEYVSAVDVLVDVGWLAPSNVDTRRQKRVEYLEQAINANHSGISEAMRGGDLLVMESPGPCCLRCAGFGRLEYLPRGDAKLTKRVAKLSERQLVVRFSRARKRYERQGLLIEPRALRGAHKELGLVADDDYA